MSLRSSLILRTVATSGVLTGTIREHTGIPSRVTVSAMTACGSLSRPSLECPLWRKARTSARATGGWRHPSVGLEPGRGGVIEHQIDIELEQIDVVPEDRLFDRIAVIGDKIERGGSANLHSTLSGVSA